MGLRHTLEELGSAKLGLLRGSSTYHLATSRNLQVFIVCSTEWPISPSLQEASAEEQLHCKHPGGERFLCILSTLAQRLEEDFASPLNQTPGRLGHLYGSQSLESLLLMFTHSRFLLFPATAILSSPPLSCIFSLALLSFAVEFRLHSKWCVKYSSIHSPFKEYRLEGD